MKRSRRIRGAAIGSVVVMIGVFLGGAAPTTAAWTDSEYAQASAAALTVQPPRNLRCTASGLLTLPKLAWTAPTTGPPTGGYSVEALAQGGIGAANGSYTLSPTTTEWTAPGTLLAVVGTWKVNVYALLDGTSWRSTAISATITQTSVVLGLSSTCSVP